jgi:hypothetical protein
VVVFATAARRAEVLQGKVPQRSAGRFVEGATSPLSRISGSYPGAVTSRPRGAEEGRGCLPSPLFVVKPSHDSGLRQAEHHPRQRVPATSRSAVRGHCHTRIVHQGGGKLFLAIGAGVCFANAARQLAAGGRCLRLRTPVRGRDTPVPSTTRDHAHVMARGSSRRRRVRS